MKKSLRIGLVAVGLLLAVPLVAGLILYVNLRRSQPQMFVDPVIDTDAPVIPDHNGREAVLVFSKTSGGFRHDWSIDAANKMIAAFAERQGRQVFYTEKGAVFDPGLLDHFSVVVWNNATGAALSAEQRQSFEDYVENGGGYVGLHAAGDNSHADWKWYTDEVITVLFSMHTLLPEHTPEATVTAENRDHPATRHLPGTWQTREEWYAFHENPRERGARILVTVDESTYTPWGASMGEDHPVVWCHELGKGRVFYSSFGHWAESYSDPLLVSMMEQAIIWAGRFDTEPEPEAPPSPEDG